MDVGEAEDEWEDPEAPVFPRVRQGIEFIARDDSSGDSGSRETMTRASCSGARSGSMSIAIGSSPR
jgi:hypothetical protein